MFGGIVLLGLIFLGLSVVWCFVLEYLISDRRTTMEVNQIVVCLDVGGSRFLRESRPGAARYYRITHVSPQGRAIRVRDTYTGQEGPVGFEARRFQDARQWLHEREANPDVPAPAPAPAPVLDDDAEPYEITDFYGCCGATIIYFDAATRLEANRLRATVNDDVLEPMSFAILNERQMTDENRKLLEDVSFKFVAQSGSNHNGGLYAFVYIKKDVPDLYWKEL